MFRLDGKTAGAVLVENLNLTPALGELRCSVPGPRVHRRTQPGKNRAEQNHAGCGLLAVHNLYDIGERGTGGDL